MNSRTHLLIAMLAGWLYFRFFDIFTFEQKFLFALFLIIGALLPDIDNPHTSMGKKHKIISSVTSHRGVLHAIWIPVIALAVALMPINNLFIFVKASLFGLAIGYLSHLIADMFTLVGVAPLAPLAKFRVRGPFKTGGWAETIIAAIVVMFFLIY